VAAVVLQLVQEGRLALRQPVRRWLPGLLTGGGAQAAMGDRLNQQAQDDVVGIGVSVGAWELRHRIFGPLGLRHTSFPVTTAHIAGYHAHGYVVLAPGGKPYDVTYLNPSGAWASGAIISTARDVARFYQALLGGQLLSPRMRRQLETTVDEVPGDPAAQSGLGIERYEDPCGVTWGHGGQIVGYQDAAYWNRRTHRVVVLATTLWPGATPAAGTLISNAYDYALCPPGTSSSDR
jgi:D-alanyl-D-alanine carboxypeptidase